MTNERTSVIGTKVDAVSWSAVLDRLDGLARSGASSIVCICNVHMVVTAKFDSILRECLSTAELVTADGAPIAWMLRRLGHPKQERINGPDLTWKFLRHAELEGLIVSFYGSSEEVLQRLRIVLYRNFPKLQVGAMIAPPYRELTVQEDLEFVRSINSAGTNALFVGLGCPKQEKWMLLHRDKVQSVMIGVGAAFDYHAGTIKRAPLWMQHNGLEWLHRLASEPSRLWKRYLVTNTIFVWYAIHQLFSRR